MNLQPDATETTAGARRLVVKNFERAAGKAPFFYGEYYENGVLIYKTSPYPSEADIERDLGAHLATKPVTLNKPKYYNVT